MGERFSRFESMLYFSKRPSSTSTIHLPQVAFSAQIDSISTPSSRAAARTEVPSSTCPRRPEGWRMMVCFLVISILRKGRQPLSPTCHSYAESQFWQTPLRVLPGPLPRRLRVIHPARPNPRACIERNNQMKMLILLPLHRRRSYLEFFAKVVFSPCAPRLLQ